MDFSFWVISSCVAFVLFLVLECLIVSLINTRKVYSVLPILAVAVLCFIMCAGAFITGWDVWGWGFAAMAAGFALIGSLLGLGVGLLFRKFCRREEKQHYEADQTI